MEITGEQALQTRVLMTPTIEAIVTHRDMTEGTQTPGETKTPAATELEGKEQTPPTEEICSANTLPYLTQSE